VEKPSELGDVPDFAGPSTVPSFGGKITILMGRWRASHLASGLYYKRDNCG